MILYFMQIDNCKCTVQYIALELESELSHKKMILSSAEDEAHEMSQRIKFNLERKAGLCIRLLNKALLSEVLSYLGPHSGAYLACKYFKLLIDEQQQTALSTSEYDETS